MSGYNFVKGVSIEGERRRALWHHLQARYFNWRIFQSETENVKLMNKKINTASYLLTFRLYLVFLYFSSNDAIIMNQLNYKLHYNNFFKVSIEEMFSFIHRFLQFEVWKTKCELFPWTVNCFHVFSDNYSVY